MSYESIYQRYRRKHREKCREYSRDYYNKHKQAWPKYNLQARYGITPEDYDRFKIIFLNSLILKILEEILKKETIFVSKIGETLDIYPGTILYHLNKLKDLNLVRSTKNKAGKKIFLVNLELLKVYNEFFKEPDFSKLLQGI